MFLGNDDVFARKCIGKAIALYKFANKFRGSYHQSIPDAVNGFQSYNGFDDELAWACLWIHKATGAKNRVWIQKATEHVRQMNRKTKIKYMNWDDKRAGVNFLYAMASNSTVHWERTKTFCDWMLPGGGAEYTPRGLLFLNEWGTLGKIQSKAL